MCAQLAVQPVDALFYEFLLRVLASVYSLLFYMKIYLLRHAEAAVGFPDSSRILSAYGREHARKLGGFLRQKSAFHPSVLWRSPYARTRETSEILLDAWGGTLGSEREEAYLEPDMNPSEIVDALQALNKDVLVVGHNPNISILASLLLSGERGRTRTNFDTCNMACLELNPVQNYGEVGPCELSWMLDPRIL